MLFKDYLLEIEGSQSDVSEAKIGPFNPNVKPKPWGYTPSKREEPEWFVQANQFAQEMESKRVVNAKGYAGFTVDNEGNTNTIRFKYGNSARPSYTVALYYSDKGKFFYLGVGYSVNTRERTWVPDWQRNPYPDMESEGATPYFKVADNVFAYMRKLGYKYEAQERTKYADKPVDFNKFRVMG